MSAGDEGNDTVGSVGAGTEMLGAGADFARDTERVFVDVGGGVYE